MNDLFSFIVDIVDWGCLDLAFFVPEGVEDRDAIDSVATCQLIVVHEAIRLDLKMELALPDGGFVISCGCIDDVNVVEDSILVFALLFVLELVGKCHQPINVGFGLPQKEDLELNVSHSIPFSNVYLCPYFLEFAFWVIF